MPLLGSLEAELGVQLDLLGQLLALALQIDYSVNRRLDVGLLYRYEDYTFESFNLEGLRPYLPSTLLLVANDGDYQADVFGISFKLDL